MKAKEIFGIDNGNRGELFHKLRTVADIIRHIKTKEESSPANYSIFLGAGASVSSGIRTGGQLTDEWSNELYERFSGNKSTDPTYTKSYFEKEHPSWYNSDNPYSSLFEKKFDLPTQRRRFVEQEVDGKLPGIGYAYLVSLVDGNYFNTIFTTNFDDLINEAFYLYSDKRPILCAHDSSIRSITITSKRPKIIKLHGDYLFDDIKSTLRETESLEQNTKEKFVEFSKEFGLIVVGYSGCDRSIMDVLEFLIKQENYLKNGIYWCLRPDDNVCHNLRNLIWKDKVYPVIIDGFDEFFAEVHSQTLKDLRLNSGNRQSKLERAVEQIVSDRFNLAKNDVISKEISSIRDVDNSKDISGFIKQLSNANDSSKFGIRDMRNLLEIESQIDTKNFTEALESCGTHFSLAKTDLEKKVYIEKYIEIYNHLNDNPKSNYWCEKLIELDPFSVPYNLKKTKTFSTLAEKINHSSILVEKFPYSVAVKNSLVEHKIRSLRADSELNQDTIASIEDHIEKSLSIDPSLDNNAWSLKSESLSIAYLKSTDAKKKAELKTQALELIKKARLQHPEHLQTLELLTSQLEFSPTILDTKGVIDFLIGLKGKSSARKKRDIDKILSETFEHAYGINDNKSVIEMGLRIYFNENNDDEDQSVSFLVGKVRYISSIQKKNIEAKAFLEKALSRTGIAAHIEKILLFPINFTQSDLDRFRRILQEQRYLLNSVYYFETSSELYLQNNELMHADQELERAKQEGMNIDVYLSRKSYLYLASDQLSQVFALNTAYTDASSCEALIINTQYAAKKIDKTKFSEVKLRNLTAQSESDEVKMCAFSLLDQYADARRLMKRMLDRDPGLIKKFKEWPVLCAECYPEFGNTEEVA